MKKFLVSVAFLALHLPTVHAAPPKAATSESVAPLAVTGPTRFAVGFATVSGFGGANGAISFWYELNPWNSIQGLAAIGGTTPFEVGVGGLYRHTVTGGTSEGLHLGGGALLGSVNAGGSQFFMRMSGLVGAHLTFPGLSRLQLSFDGGVHFDLLNNTFDIRVEPLSPALGFSVHYFI